MSGTIPNSPPSYLNYWTSGTFPNNPHSYLHYWTSGTFPKNLHRYLNNWKSSTFPNSPHSYLNYWTSGTVQKTITYIHVSPKLKDVQHFLTFWRMLIICRTRSYSGKHVCASANNNNGHVLTVALAL